MLGAEEHPQVPRIWDSNLYVPLIVEKVPLFVLSALLLRDNASLPRPRSCLNAMQLMPPLVRVGNGLLS